MSSCLLTVNNCILKFPGSSPNIIEYTNTNIASDLIGEPLKIFRKGKKGDIRGSDSTKCSEAVTS